jgi:hypothetical protein
MRIGGLLMLESPSPTISGDVSRAAIAAVLLTMQTGFGLLSALGLLVFARITGSIGTVVGAALLALLFPLLALVLAGGVALHHPWARRGALAFEAVTLFLALLRFILSRGETLALVPFLTTFALPVTVAALLLAPSSRQAIAPQQERAG